MTVIPPPRMLIRLVRPASVIRDQMAKPRESILAIVVPRRAIAGE
ncbi:MAG: hypothetical protein AAGA19_14340 [Pseudomonadota bacterium]